MVRPFVVRPLLALCVFGASPVVLAAGCTFPGIGWGCRRCSWAWRCAPGSRALSCTVPT
ncbi:hypothetical protein PS903_03487 [Pseudomonas fluorescens]|nr:hypothetical protein PS903_03487 [Pseudomonas fluorescens]